MKKLLAAVLLLLFASPVFALSDAAYLRMKKNSAAFARADRNLSRVYNEMKESLSKRVFAEIQKDQRKWIAEGRDEDADAYMEQGYSRTEAYTKATEDRAVALPELANQIIDRVESKKATPARRTQPAKKTPPARTPKKAAPAPDPEPEYDDVEDEDDEDDDTTTAAVGEIEGEYQNNNGFLTVRLLDDDALEYEVIVSRFKDEVNWKARGWLENNEIQLSDENYSRCQATFIFSAGRVKAEVTKTTDWAKATADDFVIAGTYKKLAN